MFNRNRNRCQWTILVLAVLFGCLFSLSGGKKRKSRIAAILEDVDSCLENNENMTLNYTFHGKDDYRINFSFFVGEPLSDLYYSNAFDRCASKTSETCENFLTVPIDDFCKFMKKMDDQVWSEFLKDIEPPLSCPLQGLYVLRDFSTRETVNKLTNFASLDTKNEYHYRWTMNIRHKKTQKDLACLKIFAYLRSAKSKK